MLRPCLVLALILITACNGEIYVRDHVTDGDTFYLASQALMDDDPVLQSWVSYSLTRSACQLEIGGENPARASSFDCELTARNHLLDTWDEKRIEYPGIGDDYLDTLLAVRSAGYLGEYVERYFTRPHWSVPAQSDPVGYRQWQREHLRGHKPETRITGSWNYARNTKVLD